MTEDIDGVEPVLKLIRDNPSYANMLTSEASTSSNATLSLISSNGAMTASNALVKSTNIKYFDEKIDFVNRSAISALGYLAVKSRLVELDALEKVVPQLFVN